MRDAGNLAFRFLRDLPSGDVLALVEAREPRRWIVLQKHGAGGWRVAFRVEDERFVGPFVAPDTGRTYLLFFAGWEGNADVQRTDVFSREKGAWKKVFSSVYANP